MARGFGRNAFVMLAAASQLTLSALCAVEPGDDIRAAQAAISAHDYAKAVQILEPLAKSGNSDAQCLLGEMHELGRGVPQDSAEALKWYKLSARGGQPQPYSIRIVEYGKVPNSDLKAYAAQITEKAAAGDAESQRILGTLYFEGMGVKQDFEQAFNWFQKSAAQGNVPATDALGFMYQHGAFVKQDYGKAITLYTQAADKGDAGAANNLAFMYVEGLGTPPNYTTAAELFARADREGNADAASNLGYMYQKGLGVPKNYGMAVRLYAKAGAHGVAAAKYNLGYMYEYGLGVNRQREKASHLYRLAASMGYPRGENALGFMYGNQAVAPKDYSVALKWYKQEAKRKANSFRAVPNFDMWD